MNINEKKIKEIFEDMISSDFLYCNSFLSKIILVKDNKIQTLSITLSKNPELHYNLDFINKFLKDENEIKYLIAHEIFHIIYRHNYEYSENKKEMFINNIAFDAVVNYYLYKLFGKKYGKLMIRMYKKLDPIFYILMPYNFRIKLKPNEFFENYRKLWRELYKGKVDSYFIKSFLISNVNNINLPSKGFFIGSHLQDLNNMISESLNKKSSGNKQPSQNKKILQSNKSDSEKLSESNSKGLSESDTSNCEGSNVPTEALNPSSLNSEKEISNLTSITGLSSSYSESSNNSDLSAKSLESNFKGLSKSDSEKALSRLALNKELLWLDSIKDIIDDLLEEKIKSFSKAGVGYYENELNTDDNITLKWKNKILKVMMKFSREKWKETGKIKGEYNYFLPVFSTKDKRTFMKSHWSPFIPFSLWETEKNITDFKTVFYLDVSSSMKSELHQIVNVLKSLKKYFEMDFWGFSTEVFKIKFQDNKLKYRTTGGTSIESVFDHILKKNYKFAVILTDGFFESYDEVEEKIKLLKKKKVKIGFIISEKGDATEISEYGFYYTTIDGRRYEA